MIIYFFKFCFSYRVERGLSFQLGCLKNNLQLKIIVSAKYFFEINEITSNKEIEKWDLNFPPSRMSISVNKARGKFKWCFGHVERFRHATRVLLYKKNLEPFDGMLFLFVSLISIGATIPSSMLFRLVTHTRVARAKWKHCARLKHSKNIRRPLSPGWAELRRR